MFDTEVACEAAVCADAGAATDGVFSAAFERTGDGAVPLRLLPARDRPGARGEQVGEDGACASEDSR